eukprot:TRINITY_DN38037_c0_g1_i1.p1 TRINITY_DN38037_c0_g1~~TRINITY_DN38037_c0_g1_i1.p1  ORF type:complete len:593 (+),score=36.79 TRINITY_DN38037_c0_g1_i1:25-1779(+)
MANVPLVDLGKAQNNAKGEVVCSPRGLGALSPRPKNEKGLENDPGENNCFLNVAIQALLHIKPLCKKFLETGKTPGRYGHRCSGNECVYCHIYDLVSSVEGESDSMSTRVLRRSLASGTGVQSFKLNEMNDASEVLEEVLKRLAECVEWVHDIFYITVNTEKVCNTCNKTKAAGPPYTKLMHTLPAAMLYRNADKNISPSNMFKVFESLTPDQTSCDITPKCKGTCKLFEKCPSLPSVVIIQLVWSTPCAPEQDIVGVCKLLGDRASLSDLSIFGGKTPVRGSMIGLICYYKASHYVAYFKNDDQDLWMYCDDTSVKVIGGSWGDVLTHIRTSMLQPCLLFYKPVKLEPFVASTNRSDRHVEDIMLDRVLRSTSPKPDPVRRQVVKTDTEPAEPLVKPSVVPPRQPFTSATATEPAEPSLRQSMVPPRQQPFTSATEPAEPVRQPPRQPFTSITPWHSDSPGYSTYSPRSRVPPLEPFPATYNRHPDALSPRTQQHYYTQPTNQRAANATHRPPAQHSVPSPRSFPHQNQGYYDEKPQPLTYTRVTTHHLPPPNYSTTYSTAYNRPIRTPQSPPAPSYAPHRYW